MQQQLRHRVVSNAKSLGSKITSMVPVVSWPNARQLNVFSPTSTLTSESLLALATRLASYKSNSAVAVTTFSANGSDAFCHHLIQDQKTISSMNTLSSEILHYPKDTLVFLEKNIKSSTLGPFSQAKFRLGNESTTLTLDDLAENRLPIGGGLSSLLVGSSLEGIPFARYAVAARLTLSAADMHKLGYITHIVPENSVDIIMPAIGDAFDAFETKLYQPAGDGLSSLQQMLDMMHFDTDALDSVFLHPVWEKFCVVPPSDYLEDNYVIDEPRTFSDVRDAIVHCFNQDEPTLCMKRLELIAQDTTSPHQKWAEETLHALELNDMLLMKAWFKFTKQIAKKPVTQVMKMEEQLLSS